MQMHATSVNRGKPTIGSKRGEPATSVKRGKTNKRKKSRGKMRNHYQAQKSIQPVMKVRKHVASVMRMEIKCITRTKRSKTGTQY